MEEVVIKIVKDSGEASISSIDSKGILSQKTVDIDNLITALVKDFKITTGLLPIGTRIFQGNPGDYEIIIETPTRIRNIFLGRQYENKPKAEKIPIPFPSCLFCFHIVNKKIITMRVFTIAYNLQSERDGLMYFPFGNVYEDARICWGNIHLPLINSSIELIGIINMFFDSEFNHDLFSTNYINKIVDKDGNEILDFYALVKYLKEKDTFPNEILKKHRFNFKTIFERQG